MPQKSNGLALLTNIAVKFPLLFNCSSGPFVPYATDSLIVDKTYFYSYDIAAVIDEWHLKLSLESTDHTHALFCGRLGTSGVATGW